MGNGGAKGSEDRDGYHLIQMKGQSLSKLQNLAKIKIGTMMGQPVEYTRGGEASGKTININLPSVFSILMQCN